MENYLANQCMDSALHDILAGMTRIEADRSVYFSLGCTGCRGVRGEQSRKVFYDIQLQADRGACIVRSSKFNFSTQQDISK